MIETTLRGGRDLETHHGGGPAEAGSTGGAVHHSPSGVAGVSASRPRCPGPRSGVSKTSPRHPWPRGGTAKREPLSTARNPVISTACSPLFLSRSTHRDLQGP